MQFLFLSKLVQDFYSNIILLKNEEFRYNPDLNSFCGEVVLDSVYIAFRVEEDIFGQVIHEKELCWIFIMKIVCERAIIIKENSILQQRYHKIGCYSYVNMFVYCHKN